MWSAGWQVIAILGAINSAFSQETPKTLEDFKRDAAIAEFTSKMKAANYPALFEKAAREFNVPVDVLKGIAFAETRWEHLTWPPGETVSPETGMPRPYGIMSLWDNDYFGHGLIEAAQLIGKTPEELKQDPFQNMRGAAALLKKLYDSNPKPAGSTETEVESWRYAIRKYCGIPEPDLNARHALKVYEFMAQGYHQYGIEWDDRPVNLAPIREETTQIVAEEKARREALRKEGPTIEERTAEANSNTSKVLLTNSEIPKSSVPQPAAQVPPSPPKTVGLSVAPTLFWIAFGGAILGGLILWQVRRGQFRGD